MCKAPVLLFIVRGEETIPSKKSNLSKLALYGLLEPRFVAEFIDQFVGPRKDKRCPWKAKTKNLSFVSVSIAIVAKVVSNVLDMGPTIKIVEPIEILQRIC